MNNIKTFSPDSWTTIDTTEINLEGIRYITTPCYWCRIIDADLPKFKSLIGDRLYKWALDGGSTFEIPEDEIYARDDNE